MRKTGVLTIIIVVVLCSYTGVNAWPTQVTLPGLGTIQGFKDVKGMNNFLGVPYAAPPIGSLRWRPPQGMNPWKNTVLNTINFASSCTQFFSDGFSFPNNVTFSEDCLYLNIWAPDTPSANKTVMVWIHGGGLTNGGNSEERLRGNYMASSADVIVVNIGYRLGKIGFLAHKYLAEEDPKNPTTGNYGVQDQRAALEFIKQYIHLFGGNPNDVTIMGESAGGSSVCWHLILAKSKGLFSKAIAESSACFSEITTLQNGEATGTNIQNALGCTQGSPQQILECMRSKPWSQILKLNGGANAHIDGVEFTQSPYASLTSGNFTIVPLMQGDVRTEGSGWVYNQYPNVIEPQNYLNSMSIYWHDSSLWPQIAAVYPCEAYNKTDCRAALTQAFGDFFLACPTTILGESYQNHNSYSYLFQHQPSWVVGWQWGAPHASEIEFVFSTVDIHPSFTQAELKLANSMTRHWTQFAKTGNPYYSGSLSWDSFKPATNWTRMGLNLQSNIVTNYETQQCNWWRKVYEKGYLPQRLDTPLFA